MQIRARVATLADYQSICDLFNQVDQLHRDNLPRIFRPFTGPVREIEYIESLLTDDQTLLLPAEIEGEIAAVVLAQVFQTRDLPVLVQRRFVVVDTLVIDALYRRQGVGRRLMQEVEGWGIKKGASTIELNVYEFNREAIEFYQSSGYQTLLRRMAKELT
jgi:diamine N-acetyltransferase